MPTFHRMPIKLNDKEVAKLGRELADKRLEHSSLKDEKLEELKEFNAKLKTLDAEIETLAHSVQEHVRYEEIEVRLEPDDKRLMMEVFSVKTDERVDVRQMTDDEKEAAMKRRKNPELPFEKLPRDATPAPDRVEHEGQSLTKVKRGKKPNGEAKPKASGKGRSKRGEARA